MHSSNGDPCRCGSDARATRARRTLIGMSATRTAVRACVAAPPSGCSCPRYSTAPAKVSRMHPSLSSAITHALLSPRTVPNPSVIPGTVESTTNQ